MRIFRCWVRKVKSSHLVSCLDLSCVALSCLAVLRPATTPKPLSRTCCSMYGLHCISMHLPDPRTYAHASGGQMSLRTRGEQSPAKAMQRTHCCICAVISPRACETRQYKTNKHGVMRRSSAVCTHRPGGAGCSAVSQRRAAVPRLRGRAAQRSLMGSGAVLGTGRL